jgi:hypothetical protein
MKPTVSLPLVTLLVGAAALPPPVADVQMIPPVIRKDALAQRIRYGPHLLKKATVCGPSGLSTADAIGHCG